MTISDIAKELIKFETVFPNYHNFDKCIEYIKNYYNDSNLIIKEFCYNNDKSIFISNTKDKQVDILFVGHMDVVPAAKEDFIPQVKGKYLYGRGSFDMKGHVAVMMKLLKDNKFNKKIGLLITTDEERGGFNGTGKFLNELNYSCEFAIVPDAGNNFEIIEEEKGVLQLEVSYKGIEAHSSQVWSGDNAICKILALYNFLLEKYPLPKSSSDYRTSINLAKIEGGNSLNVVAGECRAFFDIRHIASDSKENFIKLIKEYDSNITVNVLAQGEPFLTHKEHYLFKLFEQSYYEVLKKEPKFSKCESASDGRFFYSKDIPCLLMNSSGNNIHSKNEYVDIDALNILFDIYLNYIRKIENL